jgi:tetracycline 7-halogenase / FADH2 O2-dependent halogenase
MSNRFPSPEFFVPTVMATDPRSFDVVIIGSGFSGSLMAMVCLQLGRSVLILEKDSHPRFAIGESTTPLTNLLLEEIAREYSLDFLSDFSNWGSWQKSYPGVSCGLKRGFSFFHHQEGRLFQRHEDRRSELLVAASPSDSLADTHWFREEFDEFLVKKAIDAGVVYMERTELIGAEETQSGMNLSCRHLGTVVSIEGKFVIDASGPRGALFRAMGGKERLIGGMPSTRALFGHFKNVPGFGDSELFEGDEVLPYPVDDAAVHHVFPSGWFWVLRFNNGKTSAGIVTRTDWGEAWPGGAVEADWKGLVAKFPSLDKLFCDASIVDRFRSIEQLPFLAEEIHSRRWALLPSAAASIDPLFSTGFPLTLLGVIRLGRALGQFWGTEQFETEVRDYARATRDEVERVGRLVGLAYKVMSYPQVFNALTSLYFCAVSFEETNRRLRRVPIANSFYLGDDTRFRDRIDHCMNQIEDLVADGQAQQNPNRLVALIRECVEPFNVIGMGKDTKGNRFPVDLGDLFESADKLDATREEIRSMLVRSGVELEALRPFD